MNTPKTLSDVRFQDNVLHLTASKSIDTEARRWFHELFENNDPVHTRLLFTEDGAQVWEAYQDGGSVDYLYIVKGK